jgi:hypothetical protein
MHIGVGYSRAYCFCGSFIKLSKRNTQFIFIIGGKLLKKKVHCKGIKKTVKVTHEINVPKMKS